jgi:hypothetical protein
MFHIEAWFRVPGKGAEVRVSVQSINCSLNRDSI